MSETELFEIIKNLEEDTRTEVIDFIEFLSKKKELKKHKHPKAGFLKNTFIMHEGFDDIPEDFKDYID